ncbi:hypothetical protein EVAR_11412_1 [Eumeta japonica]|uniref:Uncharacterized protein n=1 Tax=Eumeta variegata TaxID=151549 RepID=A0A4C1TND5_EUMVA|nr:hypothetical protein EVAR_11412_1 [Eumeta japonica]
MKVATLATSLSYALRGLRDEATSTSSGLCTLRARAGGAARGNLLAALWMRSGPKFRNILMLRLLAFYIMSHPTPQRTSINQTQGKVECLLARGTARDDRRQTVKHRKRFSVLRAASRGRAGARPRADRGPAAVTQSQRSSSKQCRNF